MAQSDQSADRIHRVYSESQGASERLGTLGHPKVRTVHTRRKTVVMKGAVDNLK
jgi:hypothetical protein